MTQTITATATPTAPIGSGSAAKELRNAVRAETKKKGRTKKTPVDSATVTAIYGAAYTAGFITKEFGNPLRPSFVVNMPVWSEYQKTLPADEVGTELARTFHALKEAVALLAGDVASTWVLHASGSFALYSRFSG